MTGLGVVGLAIFLLGVTVLSDAAVRREEGIATGSVSLISEPVQAEQKSVYDLSRMKNLCAKGGSILFNYDSEKFRFGHSITEGEAQFIVNELNKRNPFRVG